jgi:peptide/nickel transport system permease protein
MLTTAIVGLNFFTDVLLALIDPRIRKSVMGG